MPYFGRKPYTVAWPNGKVGACKASHPGSNPGAISRGGRVGWHAR